jgi:hypothetical protein
MLFSPGYRTDCERSETARVAVLKKGANGNDFAALLQEEHLDFTALSAPA